MATYVAGRTSTYSKAAFLDVPGYPQEVLEAKGAKVLTERGPWLVDFTAALGPIILGYGYKGLQRKVRECLHVGGPLFPLPHYSEEEAAAVLCGLTGWHQVRWCKNGSDALEAAVRLARYVTGREKVITNSYHGFHSDLVTATAGRGGGILEANWLTVIPAIDVGSLQEQLERTASNDVAAVVMEPITPACTDWQLERVKEACAKAGALLIFDEVVTGFRCRLGSAVDTRPDLTCYGKAIANGYPLACVAGPRNLMRYFEKEIFFSATYAADAVSLGACLETLSTLDSHSPAIYRHFEVLTRKVLEAMGPYGRGYTGRVQINMSEDQHRELVGTLARAGFLVGRDFFFMESHTEEMVEALVEVIRRAVSGVR